MQVTIDANSSIPPYEQVRTQIAEAIAAGTVQVGDRLPPIRTLAADLRLAAGTVARAYRELEAAGIVTTRARAGTVVSDGVDPATVITHQAAFAYVATAREHHASDQQILDAVRTALTPRNLPPGR